MGKIRGWIRGILVAGGIYVGGGLSDEQERSLRPQPPTKPQIELEDETRKKKKKDEREP
jgi:hypothetical protein